MKYYLTLLLSAFTLTLYAQKQSTEILILGSDHLQQIYKNSIPNTDVLTPANQQELKKFTDLVLRYKADMVAIEVLPEKQHEIDSLYNLYLTNKLNLDALPDGRSEVYQLAFRISKQLKLRKVYCVNAPGGTSQSVLDNGENIEVYKSEAKALRALVLQKNQELQTGKLSLKDYLLFLNETETIRKVHHLRYITPARVTNGTFKKPDQMIDTAFINKKYIGAELSAVFKNRDYKIYSNILAAQAKTQSKKILLIIGVAHVGSLKSIFRDDEEYTIIEANNILKSH